MTAPRPGSAQDRLNRQSPSSKKAKLGDILADLVASQNAMAGRLGTRCLASAGLAIKAGSSAVVKYTIPILAMVAGLGVRKAIGDMPALAGTLATAKSAAWAFYIDGSATLTTSAKTADVNTHDLALAAALAAVNPAKALVGILVLDNATGAPFVGATTALDVGSLTATYYNITGPVVTTTDLAGIAVESIETR